MPKIFHISSSSSSSFFGSAGVFRSFLRATNMARISNTNLLYVALLFLYYAARYVLECILMRLPMRVEMPENCDGQFQKFFERLISFIKFCKKVFFPALAFVARTPVLFFPVSYLMFVKEWINSCVYFCTAHWPFLAASWAILKFLSRARLTEEDTWKALGRFISFTRISVGRSHIENGRTYGVRPTTFGRLPTIVPLVVQAVVAVAVVLSLATRVLSVFSSSSEHRYYRHDDFQHPSGPHYHYPFPAPHEFGYVEGPRRSPTSNSQIDMDPDSVATSNTSPDSREQFTTFITGCYDGDTCYTNNLSFNGQPLPDMFASMKIRLNGIDAPELSRANCELERCLARQAKHEIERIVESGGGHVLALQQCKPDKYGGRMVCDIITRKGKVASELMLEKGLAVSYGGKKKEFSWCQHRKGPKELKSRIDECLSEICPWHKSGSTSDCQDLLNSCFE